MNKREKEVLHSLCDGDITFSDAVSMLETTEEKIEEMLDSYSWLPSSERLAELNETEMETLSYIQEISHPFKFRVSTDQVELRFDQMKFIGSATIVNINQGLMEYIPMDATSFVQNHTEDNGVEYIQ
jgi:hypothetical protein